MPCTKSLYDQLVAFQALFESAEFDHPADCAAYYVIYTAAFNEINTFSALLDKAKELSRNISRKSLENGRRELLMRGLMATVLFTHDDEAREEFGREAYVTANPLIVWEDLEGALKTKAGDDLLRSMYTSVEQLNEKYTSFFGDRGVAIEEGKLTLYYSGVWVHYTILNLCRQQPRKVCLWISGGRTTAAQPLPERYRRILDTGSTIQVIFDRGVDTTFIEKASAQYENRLEIRLARAGTTRRVALIGDVLALDGLRILPMDMTAPGYVGTAYLDKESITELENTFIDKWELEAERI